MTDGNVERDNLFQTGNFTLHSGATAGYKIECDSLTDGDLEGLAYIVACRAGAIANMAHPGENSSGINRVHGVPRGGVRFADALQQYAHDPEGIDLIVDDVLTTGNSMEEARNNLGWTNSVGIVIFARNQPASWIKAIFEMNFFKT